MGGGENSGAVAQQVQPEPGLCFRTLNNAWTAVLYAEVEGGLVLLQVYCLVACG